MLRKVKLIQLPNFVEDEHLHLEKLLLEAVEKAGLLKENRPTVKASINEMESCLISSREYCQSFPSEFLYAAYYWKALLFRSFEYNSKEIMLITSQYAHAEEQLPNLSILKSLTQDSTYVFMTYIPPSHIFDVPSWCFTAHEIGHAVLNREEDFHYVIAPLIRKYESDIQEMGNAFSEIAGSKDSAKAVVARYLGELASDLIATSLCAEAYFYSLKEEYGLLKEWKDGHPPITVRISTVLEIFKKEGWLPENGIREETLERHAKGHKYEELSGLLKDMVEDMLGLELNGVRFRDAIAQISGKRGSQISSRIWSIFEEINQGREAEATPRGRLNDQLLPEVLGDIVFTENFTSFYEVIAYSSLLRAFFGSNECIDKAVIDAVHRTFVKSLYEKSMREK